MAEENKQAELRFNNRKSVSHSPIMYTHDKP